MNGELIQHIAFIVIFAIVAVIALKFGLKNYNHPDPIDRTYSKGLIILAFGCLFVILVSLAQILP